MSGTLLSGERDGVLSSIGKSGEAKLAGVPPWQEQLAQAGTALWRDLPNHADEMLAALVLLLAFGVLAAAL